MQIPKYIEDALERRANAAQEYIAADSDIQAFLENNDIKINPDHILTGACALMEPFSSTLYIKRIIEEK